jgi:hypothetical protein
MGGRPHRWSGPRLGVRSSLHGQQGKIPRNFFSRWTERGVGVFQEQSTRAGKEGSIHVSDVCRNRGGSCRISHHLALSLRGRAQESGCPSDILALIECVCVCVCVRERERERERERRGGGRGISVFFNLSLSCLALTCRRGIKTHVSWGRGKFGDRAFPVCTGRWVCREGTLGQGAWPEAGLWLAFLLSHTPASWVITSGLGLSSQLRTDA